MLRRVASKPPVTGAVAAGSLRACRTARPDPLFPSPSSPSPSAFFTETGKARLRQSRLGRRMSNASKRSGLGSSGAAVGSAPGQAPARGVSERAGRHPFTDSGRRISRCGSSLPGADEASEAAAGHGQGRAQAVVDLSADERGPLSQIEIAWTQVRGLGRSGDRSLGARGRGGLDGRDTERVKIFHHPAHLTCNGHCGAWKLAGSGTRPSRTRKTTQGLSPGKIATGD